MSDSAISSEPGHSGLAEAALSVEQISSYYLELDRLLDAIERATTYYHILSVDRTASLEEIRDSYLRAVTRLFPAYAISAVVPPATLTRMERAFTRVTGAMAVLGSQPKRAEYDNVLGGKLTKGLDPTAPKAAQNRPAVDRTTPVNKAAFIAAPTPPAKPAPQPAAQSAESIDIKRLPFQREVYKEFSKSTHADNRRRCERFRLSIPVRATGHDRKNGKWNEMAQTVDVSRTGVNLRLQRRVRHGTVLFLTLPLPTKLRTHGYSDSTYNVYALVRRVDPPSKGTRLVGLEFLGEHPPPGYLEKPWATFRTGRWGGSERRRRPRVDRQEVVWIEYLTDALQSLGREQAVTENLSRTGARILVKGAPVEFDLVKITATKRSFESFAALRNRYYGKDKVERICVEFTDKEFPC